MTTVSQSPAPGKASAPEEGSDKTNPVFAVLVVAILALMLIGGLYAVIVGLPDGVKTAMSETMPPADTAVGKLLNMVIAVALFFGVMGLILALSTKLQSRNGERLQTVAFLLPTVLMIAIGLLYPALLTIKQSFMDPGLMNYVGFDNYKFIFTDENQLRALGNTAIWVIVVPLVSTAIGLVYAILIDGSKFEKIGKALIFLPMAISLVGASIIWKFVYAYRANGQDQIGVLNQLLQAVGMDTYKFLLEPPWNTFFLIVILIWVQAGFAMTILSASIRAIPEDIIEAARLDGVSGLKMFRYITVPSIRPSLIVVLTTISIATLKVFDIVRTATGGQFKTSVLANEFYVQSFRSFNFGLGAALGTLIFVLVAPIVVYNVRQMREVESR